MAQVSQLISDSEYSYETYEDSDDDGTTGNVAPSANTHSLTTVAAPLAAPAAMRTGRPMAAKASAKAKGLAARVAPAAAAAAAAVAALTVRGRVTATGSSATLPPERAAAKGSGGNPRGSAAPRDSEVAEASSDDTRIGSAASASEVEDGPPVGVKNLRPSVPPQLQQLQQSPRTAADAAADHDVVSLSSDDREDIPERPQKGRGSTKKAKKKVATVGVGAQPTRQTAKTPPSSAAVVAISGSAISSSDGVSAADTSAAAAAAAAATGGSNTALGAPHLLEPLAARRLDRTLAVEPIELALERQSSSASGGGGGGGEGDEGAAPLRYGEGFRLRAAGVAGLYLGHGARGGPASLGLHWIKRPAACATLDGKAPPPPRGTRFAAHGGELGAPLLFGRPLSLQRVSSPPVSPESSDVEDSEEGSDSDASGSRGHCRRPGGCCRVARAAAAAAAAKEEEEAKANKAAATAASALLPEADRYAAEGLFSRAADVEGVFPATLLPLLDDGGGLSGPG